MSGKNYGGKSIPMGKDDAARIQSAGAKNTGIKARKRAHSNPVPRCIHSSLPSSLRARCISISAWLDSRQNAVSSLHSESDVMTSACPLYVCWSHTPLLL